MNPNPQDYNLYIDIAGRFAVIGDYGAFVVGSYFIWRMTCRISMGFDLIGRFVTLILFFGFLLLWRAPERVTLFRIVIYLALNAWVWYTVWYFRRYPIPAEYLKAVKNPALPSSPAFLPKGALMRYLVRDSPVPKEPWYFSGTFKNIASVIGVIMLLVYGFTQTIEGYSWGLKFGAAVRRQAAIETKKAVADALAAYADTTKKVVQKSTDTVVKNQQKVLKKLAQDSLLTKSKPGQLKKPASKPVSKERPLLFIPSISPIRQIISTPDYSDKVKPPDAVPVRRGRKVSQLESDPQAPSPDSLLARQISAKNP